MLPIIFTKTFRIVIHIKLSVINIGLHKKLFILIVDNENKY